MAARYATRRYATLTAFLAERQSTLRLGALVLPADALEDEPSPELQVDLVVPLLGRIGPIRGQVLQRLADGGVALRVPELPREYHERMAQLDQVIEELATWLVQTGRLAEPRPEVEREIQALREQVRALAARPPAAAAPAGGAGAVLPATERPRGHLIPDLRDVPPSGSGALGDRSLRDQLMRAAVGHTTGVLTVRFPDGQLKYGLWSKGGPVGWRTDPIDEQEVLGVLLFRSNQITREQLAESLERMERTGMRQGEALIDMGVFNFAQLVLVLQKQAEFVLQRMLKRNDGTWTFHDLPDLPERFVNPPIRVASILFRQLRQTAREMAAEDVASALRPWLDRYVFLAPGSERTFEEMKLTADEQAFVKIVAGTSYRLRELFAVSSLSRSGTAGMIWTLADLGLVEFRAEEARERVEERIARLVAGRKQALALSLFERLDLHWICTTSEVEAAYARLSQEFAPGRAAVYGDRFRADLERIDKALKEAYETLRNEASRREYRASIIEAAKIQQSASMLAGKGDMAVMKGVAKEALDCFTKAIELVPNSAEFKDGLARAKGMRAS